MKSEMEKPRRVLGAVGGIIGEVTRVAAGEVRRLLRKAYVIPALAPGMIAMTIPTKPTSRKQKYRFTQKGRDLIAKLAGKKSKEKV